MSLFNAAPFPRLSAIEGTTRTRLSSASGVSPKRSLSATRIAKAPSVEMTNEGRSPFSKIQEKPWAQLSFVVSNREPSSDSCAGRAGLRVYTWAAIFRGNPCTAWVVPLLLDFGGEVSKYELNVRRYVPHRVPGVSAYKFKQRAQERPFVSERARYEHDTAQSLLELSHIYRIRFRYVLCPACEPLSPSRGYVDASRTKEELKPYPHKNIPSGCLVPG